MSWHGAVNVVKNFFSEVFKRHTEDAEQDFIVGAMIGTIPDTDLAGTDPANHP